MPLPAKCIVALAMKTRLRTLLAEKARAQAELAAQLGVARDTTNAIEAGITDPRSASRIQDRVPVGHGPDNHSG